MSGTRPSVLLVDDVEANLIALEAQLGTMGCDLVRARNGNEALRLLLKNEFAVMLLDVQMPDMDGYEVARYAREHPRTRELPIIFVTAMHETEANTLEGYGSGAVDLLFKPINPHILCCKVQIFLDLYNSRRRLADEVEAHRKTLAEIEAFNYSVSHDLRAPLRPLDGFSQALLEDYGDKLDATAKDYLVRIRAAAQRMSQLIEDLLRLSRISRAEIKVQSVDVSALAESIVADIRANDSDRNVEFLAQPEMRASADPRLLRIALENLLRNAWKFTNKKPTSKIEFGRKTERDETSYFLRDDGVGFDPAYASKLFHPFHRLHSATEFEGTGIGLAIVQRIIGHHGGKVWAESSPGGGATFFFTLNTQRGQP